MKAIFGFIKKYSVWIFVLYMLVLVFVLIFKFPSPIFDKIIERMQTGNNNVYVEPPNFMPLKTIIRYVLSVRAINDWFFKNLICNVLMFMPFGFLVPFFIKNKKLILVLLYGIIVSIIIEFVQWITKFGIVDVDDVILNIVGIVIGYGLFRLFTMFVQNKEEQNNG